MKHCQRAISCLSLNIGKLSMLQSFLQCCEYSEDFNNDFPENFIWVLKSVTKILIHFYEILFVAQ